MPPVGFESTISAGERRQTYYLDRATTGTGLYRMSEKDCTHFIFFLGAQYVESGVSCTDCYYILLVLIEITAVPVGTKC
jgi:hypothetical protein